MKNKLETIVLGGGCFWCTEAVFSMLEGVVKVTPGYAGGTTENPTYEQVCGGDTGHAEVLRVEYDPELISFEKLLDVFFSMHDPTSINRQGNDTGSQYRSVILYSSGEQKKEAEEFIKRIQINFDKPVATEVKKLLKFYPAEPYHQDYYKKNPLQPYCLFVVRPKVDKVKKKFNLR
jgi:peptide-methionine (S)-S-oxide reductase